MFKSKKQKFFSVIVFSIYFIMLTWLILFKLQINFGDLPQIRSINLIPFKESLVINGRIRLDEILYNILVFVPFGVYIAMFKPDWSFIKKAVPCFWLSFLYEAVQFIAAIGASDITDVIDNTIGGIVGIFLFALFHKLFGEKRVTVINIVGFTIELAALVMFILVAAANAGNG